MEDTLDTRGPLVASFLQGLAQILIKIVELVDEDILEGVAGTKLVDFVTR